MFFIPFHPSNQNIFIWHLVSGKLFTRHCRNHSKRNGCESRAHRYHDWVSRVPGKHTVGHWLRYWWGDIYVKLWGIHERVQKTIKFLLLLLIPPSLPVCGTNWDMKEHGTNSDNSLFPKCQSFIIVNHRNHLYYCLSLQISSLFLSEHIHWEKERLHHFCNRRVI